MDNQFPQWKEFYLYGHSLALTETFGLVAFIQAGLGPLFSGNLGLQTI